MQGTPQRIIRKISGTGDSNTRKSLRKERHTVEMLSPFERNLVRDSWGKIKDRQEFGINIMRNMFDTKPAIKAHFNIKNVSAVADLVRHPHIKQIANQMMRVLGECIHSIDNMEDRIVHLRRLGHKHKKLTKTVITPDDWRTFVIAVNHVVTEEFAKEKNKGEIREAWKTLMTFIVKRMQEGYKEQDSLDETTTKSST